MTCCPRRPTAQGSGSSADGYEMDAATQSVSNALRTSFLALKVVLLLLVVLYLCTGYFSVPPGSRAVVVQFGRIQGLDSPAGAVLQPGPHWMWPWPISDKIIKNMEKPNSLALTSFWFYLDPRLRGLTIDEILKKAAPPEAMTPGVDGYLLTGEQEIVHLQLAIKYRIEDLVAYVTRVGDEQKLVRIAAEWACTQTVGRMRTDTVVRGEDDTIKGDLKRLMQKKLEDQVGPALSIVDIIVDERTVPLQVRPAVSGRRSGRKREAQGRQRRPHQGHAGPQRNGRPRPRATQAGHPGLRARPRQGRDRRGR